MIPKFLKQKFMILTYFVTMIHDSASNPDRNKTMTNIYLGKVKKKIRTDYTQYCTTLAVHFARQAQLSAHGCQKSF